VELASLSQRVRILTGENSYLQEKVAELTTSLRHREESLRRQGVQATTDVARISRLMGEVEASKAAIEAARAKSGQVEGELTSLKTLFVTLENSVVDYRCESEKLVESHRHAVQELSDCSNALTFYKALAARHDRQEAQLVAHMAEQDAKLHTLQGIVLRIPPHDRTCTY
jgi:chromosome segregation ATPase